MSLPLNQILVGDVLARIKDIPDESVNCVVTSPPYWGLRDYGVEGQLGLEATPEEYVARMVGVFREVRRVLRSDGTLWLNIGDSYAASGKGGGGSAGARKCWTGIRGRTGFRMPPPGFKMKDLTLTAFKVAEALRSDGWYLRSTVIWEKPSAVEPMRLDRPAVSHEYIFLFSKSEHYFTRNPGAVWWGHSVWTVTADRDGEHEAPMPLELAGRCILASSRKGDLIFDPFLGYGTTAISAIQGGRDFIGIELNPKYAAMAERRIAPELAQGRLA